MDKRSKRALIFEKLFHSDLYAVEEIFPNFELVKNVSKTTLIKNKISKELAIYLIDNELQYLSKFSFLHRKKIEELKKEKDLLIKNE